MNSQDLEVDLCKSLRPK